MRRNALVWLLGAVGWCAPTFAQTSPTTHLQVDVGIGHESQSAPLFQLTPESTILYQDGVDRLSGSHLRTALQGSAEWTLEHGMALSMAADATLKRSPGTPGFDFSALSLAPTLTLPWGGASLGLGGSLQTIEVAGQHFRDTAGLQLNWTHADGTPQDGMQLWGVVAETSRYFHADAMAEMDADSASIVVLRQFGKPFSIINAIEGIDFTAIVARENNLRGIAELSNRSGMFSLLLRGSVGEVQWSVGRSWRHARFDGAGLDADVAREDHTTMLDLALQWTLHPGQALRVELNEAHNVSTVRLFDNLYHQLSVTLRSSY
jgi:hypothetical protein